MGNRSRGASRGGGRGRFLFRLAPARSGENHGLRLPPPGRRNSGNCGRPLMTQDRPLVVCLAAEARTDAKLRSPSVTGLATANGAFLLGQFLANRIQNVYVTGSDALTMPELSMGNFVYLGQPANRLGDRYAGRSTIRLRSLRRPQPASAGRGAGDLWGFDFGRLERSDGELRADHARTGFKREGRHPIYFRQPHVRCHRGSGGLYRPGFGQDAGRGAAEIRWDIAAVLPDRDSRPNDGRNAHRDYYVTYRELSASRPAGRLH